jgi:hypothetical protein
MPLPLLPLLIVGGLVLVGTAGKNKRPENGGEPPPEGAVIPISWEELQASSEIGIDVGDTLQSSLPEAPPAEWNLYTEVIGGDPIIVVTEDAIPAPEGAEPGNYGTKVFNIKAEQAGQIKADLLDMVEDTQDVYAQHSFTLNIA